MSYCQIEVAKPLADAGEIDLALVPLRHAGCGSMRVTRDVINDEIFVVCERCGYEEHFKQNGSEHRDLLIRAVSSR